MRLKEAQTIIEAFEVQEEKSRTERLPKLRKNDYVEYIGGTKSKHLIIGKKYRLTSASFNGRFAIINDAGKRIVIWPRYFKY